MLQDRLDASGYRTFTASDGQRGIELIEQESPNLVLLDLYLPRLKGMDVLKRMAQNKQIDDIPVIVMTAAGTIPDAVEAMRQGAYDFDEAPRKRPSADRDSKGLGAGLVEAAGGRPQIRRSEPVRHHRRRQPEDQIDDRIGAARRQFGCQHSVTRGERNGQGTLCAFYPPVEPAPGHAHGRDQLRGTHGNVARERTFRS